MYFGIKPRNNILENFTDFMDEKQYTDYHDKFEKLMKSYEQEMQTLYEKEYQETQTSKNKVDVGDLVILRSAKSIHKEGRGLANYQDQVFEILEIHNQRCVVTPLFHKSRRTPSIHLSHVRKIPQSELLQMLPIELQVVIFS